MGRKDFALYLQVDRKEKQLRGETAARQQLELQLDRLANQVCPLLINQQQRIINHMKKLKSQCNTICSEIYEVQLFGALVVVDVHSVLYTRLLCEG